MDELYPMLLESALHTRVWGGRKLAEVMGKTLPTDEPYGESWEVHDTSKVLNGAYAGRTLGDLLPELGAQMIGTGNDPAEGLPLLIKILDAADWLSVQVHPDDAQARELESEPRGKTEAWFIIDADPHSRLIIGVKPGTDRDAMAQAIRETHLEDLLVDADVKPGDLLYIQAGTVHAIGPGCLIYEVQQSSDTTYRLYDWGRMGLDGNPRPLHIEKGIKVSNVDSVPEITHPVADNTPVVTITKGDYFTTALHRLSDDAPTHLHTNGNFHTLTCIKGTANVATDDMTITMPKGSSAFIPASVSSYTMQGDGEVLRSWQGD